MNLEPQAGGAAANDAPLPKWIVPAGFVVGCALLATILGIALKVPSPTSSQQTIFHTVVALAGAGYSMSLTGFLSVKLNLPNKGALVAGGTLAVFIVLFFFSPDVGGNNNIDIDRTRGDVNVEVNKSKTNSTTTTTSESSHLDAAAARSGVAQ